MVLAILIISILSLLVSILSLIFVWVYTVDRDATLDEIECYQKAAWGMIMERVEDIREKIKK